jgi:hypothetical protein
MSAQERNPQERIPLAQTIPGGVRSRGRGQVSPSAHAKRGNPQERIPLAQTIPEGVRFAAASLMSPSIAC